ncbi:MAG: DUF397 domain-containing protein [Actinoallomurus sp.]
MDVVTTSWRKSSRSGGSQSECVEIAVVEKERD